MTKQDLDESDKLVEAIEAAIFNANLDTGYILRSIGYICGIHVAHSPDGQQLQRECAKALERGFYEELENV